MKKNIKDILRESLLGDVNNIIENKAPSVTDLRLGLRDISKKLNSDLTTMDRQLMDDIQNVLIPYFQLEGNQFTGTIKTRLNVVINMMKKELADANKESTPEGEPQIEKQYEKTKI